jgi:hypothetical protein
MLFQRIAQERSRTATHFTTTPLSHR